MTVKGRPLSACKVYIYGTVHIITAIYKKAPSSSSSSAVAAVAAVIIDDREVTMAQTRSYWSPLALYVIKCIIYDYMHHIYILFSYMITCTSGWSRLQPVSIRRDWSSLTSPVATLSTRKAESP